MNTIMRPIQIYLDSSDFSDMCNLANKPSEYNDVLQYLLKKRNEGLINMRFSEAHVIESAPTTQSAIPAALDRLRVIKELCGKNSLIHPIDLIASEVSLDSPGSDGRVHVLRKDGAWLPVLFDLSEIIPDVEQSMRQDVEKMGRTERRKYLKNGKPTALWYAEMREANSGIGPDLASKLPLSPGAIRTVKRYFTGEVSRNEALKALHDSITDLEVAGQWYEKDWSSAITISKHLREIGLAFETALRDAREQFKTMIEEKNELGIESKKLLDLSVRSFYEVLAGSSYRLANKFAAKIGASAKPTGDSWQASPGLTCSITLAMHIARRSITSMPSRNPKPSDFPDCYHALYFPYVDVFRADGFMAGMLRECKMPFSTVIVDKFLQLPSKVDELLAMRNREMNCSPAD